MYINNQIISIHRHICAVSSFKRIAIILCCVYCCSPLSQEGYLLDKEVLPSNDICDYYCLDITTDSVVDSKTYGVSRFIDCDGATSVRIKAIRSKDGHLGIVFYDNDKKCIDAVPFSNKPIGKDGFISVEIPFGSSFFRTSYYNTISQTSKGCPFEYYLTDYSEGRFRKKQSGHIFFGVNVIQDFDHYSKGREGTRILATTSVLTLPDNYDPEGKPVPIIMYCHGYSHAVYYDCWGSTESFREQKKHWTDKGFAVFDCNGARNNDRQVSFYSAGAPQFVEAMRLTYEYIATHYNVSDEIYIVGGSAGGPLALNYARFNKNVKAVALLSPWTDLYNCIWQQGHRYIFEEFYDFPADGVYYSDKVNYYDPSNNMDDFSTPVKIWVGSLEKSGFIYKNSVSFYDAMVASGKDIDFEVVKGLKHSELVSGADEYIDTSVAEWFMSFESM